jgi:predicted SnoaL-like aldol condensation-catalyzing enzyme
VLHPKRGNNQSPYGDGRSVAWIAADIVRIENGRLGEHWDVLKDEATKAESKSGLPMFGDRFTD